MRNFLFAKLTIVTDEKEEDLLNSRMMGDIFEICCDRQRDLKETFEISANSD